MCGLVAILDVTERGRVHSDVLIRMTRTIAHRGPDDFATHAEAQLGLGFTRLGIVDIDGGRQPLANEDGTLWLVCNGEIFNHRELRGELEALGHVFATHTDVEVILHLYEEEGPDLLARLNGQFAFVLWDTRQRKLFSARDPFGIAPLFWTITDGLVLVASEIKALLAHPSTPRQLDLVGLDQVFTFPGLVSPRTMFERVHSLPAGHTLTVDLRGDAIPRTAMYWDLDYPELAHAETVRTETAWLEELGAALRQSVRLRLQADVPVGFYLSGGLDSSLIAAISREIEPGAERHSFAIDFPERLLSEGRFQRMMARHVRSIHHETLFRREDMVKRLKRVVAHTECPIKETFDTAAMALSELVRSAGIKVVLAGQGADEIFGGYVGYRFDRFRTKPTRTDPHMQREAQLRTRLFGDANFLYERDYLSFRKESTRIYSARVREQLDAHSCLDDAPVDPLRIRRRDIFHQRSYVDVKLRLQDHLLGDHGDRMSFANAVEGRFPFLDPNVIDVARRIPPTIKLKDFEEKYLLKQLARPLVPREIVEREKFGFAAPGSPYLLQAKVEWVADLLSPSRLRREGIFDPDEVTALARRFAEPGFRINVPFESDPLMIVITTGIFLETFQVSVPSR